MKSKKLLISTLLLLCLAPAASADEMWYRQPADEWMKAAPIGNGRLGGMVYGGVSKERIAINEISMWSGSFDPTSNDLCGKEQLAEMRQKFFEGDLRSGHSLGDKYLNGRLTTFGTHVPVGDIVISLAGQPNPDSYERRLSLSDAVASVSYKAGDAAYHREYLTSYPDNVLAIRYTSSKKKALTASVSYELLRESEVKATGNELSFGGQVSFAGHGDGGVKFFGSMKVVTDGGTVKAGDKSLEVSGADAFTIFFDLRTDYNRSDYEGLCRQEIEKAVKKGYKSVRKDHVADHKRLYDRMSLNLGSTCDPDIATDEYLANAKNRKESSAFDALFFQYGRYMLIASSRKTDMPLCANLQGIWNDNGACNMPWNCDYHLDINIQQNYWSANRANLAECNEPLFDYLGLLAKHGRETAQKMYGADGWVAHTVCNAWGYTAPGWGYSWGLNVTAGAWLATHLWSHYLYTADTDYLRNTAYPILSGAARFFSDYMVKDPETGYLVTGPSVSPENGYIGTDGGHYSLSMMPTIDRVMVYEIYDACIRSADILGINDDFTAKLRRDIALLPPLKADSRGMLCEWLKPVRRSDESHRHSSHVHALFPFDQITPAKTPDLAEACRKSLASQTSDPRWEDTEWSTANMLCFSARLRDGEKAHGWLQNLFRRFTRENLMTVSPAGVAGAEYDIFSFDATEASVAGMCEMLMQCQDGAIDFLPALPSAWANGDVKGLCAYDGIVVDMSWRNGKMTAATLRSTAKDCDVSIKGRPGTLAVKKGKSVKIKF